MPRRVACRRCGFPSPSSLCAKCRGETYDAQDYRVNSAIIRKRAAALLALGGFVPCIICGHSIRSMDELTIEHLASVGQGGSNVLGNLAPAHAKCNYGKRPAIH